MKENQFHKVADEIIKEMNFYKRAAARYLRRGHIEKEIIIKPEDVFQQTFYSFYSRRGGKGRRWRTDQPVKKQFLIALKSTAYDMIRKEINRIRCSDAIKAEAPQLCTPTDAADDLQAVSSVLNQYYKWIIDNNKVELFFVLNEMLEQKKDEEIAQHLELPLNRVKYIKKVIRENLRSMK